MNTNYIYGNVRISVLQDDIIRFEYVPNNHYTNEETLFVSKKKETDFKLDIKEDNKVYFNYSDLVFSFEKDNPLETLEVFKNNKRIYRYEFIKNSGELPLPNSTPEVFPVMDSPRLILPFDGYDVDSKYIYEKDAKDLFLIICKGDYKLLRKQYISLTGNNDMPRMKTFGLFNSRYYEWNEKSAKEMIEKYKKRHIPLDNFVLDTDWRTFDKKLGVGYNINTKLFPNLSNFYHYCHKHDIEVIMNDHPSPLLKKYNVLSPEEIEYRKNNLTKFFNIGLDSWWYDRNWFVSLISISKRIPTETLGRYIYHDITKQFYQGLVIDPEVYVRPVTLSNITEIGNGKYEGILDSKSHTYAFQWSGDIPSDLASITTEIINMNKCANNMVSYYSSDIGGHTGNPNKNEFIRWYQYGCFSPILRPHATKSVTRFREPWVFGERTFKIIKEYIYMRYRLLNVIYTNAFKNFHDGLGIFRPLYLNYPNDKKVYKEATSYMLGDNILISPICEKEKKKVKKNNYIGPVYASFYNGTELKGKALLTKRIKDINFSINRKPLYKGLPIYNFSARYKFKLKFNQDVDLYAANNDGVRVFINDKKVIDEWKERGETYNEVMTLKRGVTYKIKIEYFNVKNNACLGLYYVPKARNKKTKIYLPEGEWYNLSHRNVYQGKRYLKEKYKMEEMPLFIKAGSLLPLYKNVDNISKISLKNIIYDYYPSRDITTNDYFYEDDGVTTGYRVDVYRISRYKLEFKDNYYQITLFKSEDNLYDNLSSRLAIFKMHVRDREIIDRILINDEEIKYKMHHHNPNIYPFSDSEWSRDSKTCCFKFKQDINKEYIIKIYVK